MDENRLNRLSGQLKKDLSEIFQREGQNNFPGTLISVTQIRLTQDVSLARVYLSIFPTTRSQDLVDWATANKPMIKDTLVRKLKGGLRSMPDLKFFLDDSIEYEERIDKLLKGEGDSPIK